MDGFKQIVAHINNYDKTNGYLAVYNLNPIEISIKSDVTGQQLLQRVLC